MEERHKAAQKRKQDEQFERFKKEIKTEIKSEPVDKKPKVEKIDEKWIHKKIVVKIMAKKLGEKFYKQKGFIEKTEDYTAVVQVFENKKRAKIDQADLETVIPSVGRDVVILTGNGSIFWKKNYDQSCQLTVETRLLISLLLNQNKGKYRGEIAELKKIESSKFIAKVDLDGKELSFPYESISKLHVKSWYLRKFVYSMHSFSCPVQIKKLRSKIFILVFLMIKKFILKIKIEKCFLLQKMQAYNRMTMVSCFFYVEW